jgi:hypothetical protein
MRKLLPAALALALAGCGPARAPEAPTPATPAAPGDPSEPPLAADLLTSKAIASLFSYPGPLDRAPAELGPEWQNNGKVAWALSFTSPDGTFAAVTIILFDGRFRGMTLTAAEKDMLRTSDAFHDLDFGGGRKGYAMRAGALETASIPSPRGRYELLLLIDVPHAGPREGKGSEAYRSLLMDYPVKLIGSVAQGLAELWAARAAPAKKP